MFFMFPCNALLFVRFFSGIFPTILFGFAHPLNVFSLFILHVAFVFVFIVSFAAVTSEITYSNPITKVKIKLPKKLLKCIAVFLNLILMPGLLIIIIILAYACILMGEYGVTVAQGYVTTDGGGAVVSLVPSMALFLIGWLIKWSFFSEPGRCFKEFDEINIIL